MLAIRSFAASSALLLATAVQADGPAVSRYRVLEVNPPASFTAGCQPGYAITRLIGTINDFSAVNGTVFCYTNVIPDPVYYEFLSRTLVAAPWFGSIELPPSEPGQAHSYAINNRGEAFGYEGPQVGGALFGVRWSLAGGRERIFDDPACEFIRFSAATDGNGRYTVGWALRGDPNLPPPVDQLCITTRWMIRDASGVESSGPLCGSAYSLNAFNVAVGTSIRSAIRYHVVTGETLVLHEGDENTSAEAVHINDLGEIAGRLTIGQGPCPLPSVAVRWDRKGREEVLPHLPGAASSHAYAVGYDGEMVGDSGAGRYCTFGDNSSERAVLWKGGRAYDLNALIPRSQGITLTFASSVNRRGQITAGGYDNDEPLTQCGTTTVDPETGSVTNGWTPCRHTRMYVLTPVGDRR